MTCNHCASDLLKDFTAELAIHFPGLQGLDKPIVWVFPKVQVCFGCGVAQFVVPEAELEVLRNPETPSQWGRSAAV